jgi:hypothetical protein
MQFFKVHSDQVSEQGQTKVSICCDSLALADVPEHDWPCVCQCYFSFLRAKKGMFSEVDTRLGT